MLFDDDIDNDILKAFTFVGSGKHDPPPKMGFCLSWLTKEVKLTRRNLQQKEKWAVWGGCGCGAHRPVASAVSRGSAQEG